MDDKLHEIACGDPELLIDLNSIPDPPAELDQEAAEYYYRICDRLIRSSGLSKIKAIIAAALAKSATDMKGMDYFKPLPVGKSSFEKKLHHLAEFQAIYKEMYLMAKTIGTDLDELEKLGIPIKSQLQEYQASHIDR